MHPFEKSKLGTAPFRCTGVTKNTYQACRDAPVQAAGSCDYCGTCIAYEFHIVGSDGRKFIVGSDCVAKTHADVEGFRAERLKLARDQRATKREARHTERRAKWATEAASKLAQFKADNVGFCARLEAATDEFATKMRASLAQWGQLTGPQIDALEKGWARTAQREADKAASKFVGVLGKRITGKFTIVAVKSWESNFGWPRKMVYWHLLKIGSDLCSYKGIRLGERGETVEGAFTVKEHETYQGTQQTKLARPKLVEQPDPGELARERAEDAEHPHDEPKDHAYNNADRTDAFGELGYARS